MAGILRSLLAVVCGYFAMATVVMALFAVAFRIPGTTPTMGFMLLSLGYGFFAAGLGGYVAAVVARREAIKHAAALAGLCTALGVVSGVAEGGRAPLWYQIANIAVMVPGVLLGGYLRARQPGLSGGGGTPQGSRERRT